MFVLKASLATYGNPELLRPLASIEVPVRQSYSRHPQPFIVIISTKISRKTSFLSKISQIYN